MDRTQELEDQVKRLSRTVEEMRARMASLEERPLAAADGSGRNSRRGFLRLGVAAAATALGWVAVKAVPATAATGGNMLLGCANLAENATTLAADSGNPVPVLSVAAQSTTWNPPTTGTFDGPLQGLGTSDTNADGVDGWAGGTTGAGVYGLSDSGYGVIGESSTGIALYARTSGRIRQDGPFAGAPTHSPNFFEQVRDSSGVLWIHNATGVWRRVNTVRTDAADGSGNPFKPFRLVDTRLLGGNKAPGAVYPFPVAGTGSGTSAVPSDAIAVVGNLTAVAYTGPGFLAIMPAGITVGTGAGQYNPAADPSSVNFITGQGAIANSFVCGLSGGALQVYVGDSSSQFIIDITAYIQ